MKTFQKGFISPLLLALIALLLIGGGAYVYMQNKQASQPAVISQTTQATSTAQTSASQTVGWKTYENTEKSYSISYPADAIVDTRDLLCVQIYTKEFGSVSIDTGSQNACEPTGIGSTEISSQDSITIAGKQYPTSGWRESDNHFSFFYFSNTNPFPISNKIVVIYGVEHYAKSENLGALTDAEYQTALNSAKEIVSTLKQN